MFITAGVIFLGCLLAPAIGSTLADGGTVVVASWAAKGLKDQKVAENNMTPFTRPDTGKVVMLTPEELGLLLREESPNSPRVKKILDHAENRRY